MSKATVLQNREISQTNSSPHTSDTVSGFEPVGGIIKRLMTNLARHGDMLHGEAPLQRTTYRPNTRKGR